MPASAEQEQVEVNDVWDLMSQKMDDVAEKSVPAQTNEAVMAGAGEEQVDLDAEGKLPLPAWVKKMHADYLAHIAHTFIIHGNINDYPDNTGNTGRLDLLLSSVFDSYWLYDRLKEQEERNPALPKSNYTVPVIPSIYAQFTVNNGLVFPHADSKGHYQRIIKDFWSSRLAAPLLQIAMNPANDISQILMSLNYFFEASKALSLKNEASTSGAIEKEVKFTVTFFDSDSLFPNRPMADLGKERYDAVCHIRNWARDTGLASRNRIILVSKHLEDVQQAIRAGDSGVSAILIKKPDVTERKQWLTNFDARLKLSPKRIAGVVRDSITYANGVDHNTFAVNAAGLSQSQMHQIIQGSWRNNEPLTLDMIQYRKKESLTAEYGGLIDIVESTFGFEMIGGHQALKDYHIRKVIAPMRSGDHRKCSEGALLTGPPGTGKSMFAMALAREAKMNFLKADLGKLFGGIVGETEGNLRRFLEAVWAAAPCVLFMDELDSVLSSGRTSAGDGGTAGRVFNGVMTFLSDQTRVGKIYVLGATNRPDLLDAAMIRAGRFGAILPALPPKPSDIKGRMSILKALTLKYKLEQAFDKNLAKTVKDPKAGFGRMLLDERVWTGAEMEVVLKEAIDIADMNEHRLITQGDWEEAMDSVMPNTEEVELQTKLALLYVNNLRYCPPEWRDEARDKKQLKRSVDAILTEGGLEREV